MSDLTAQKHVWQAESINMMHLSRIFKQKKSRNRVADELLAKISSQARDPAFFGEGKTADTLDGRFEIVTLHAVLVLRRLRDFGPDGKKLANTLYTRLFSQFDHAGQRAKGPGPGNQPRE